jgi:DNA-binding winged helix-turn-helix (wHTH) protein/tetratricopeptide (TPR) repeat protein
LKDEATYTFGPFTLDGGRRLLLHGGTPLRLTPKEIDVLAALVVHHGEIVDKTQLLEEVWRGVCVEECNLSQHIAALRRILGDDAHQPIYIETVARRGYRFVAPVVRESGPGPTPLPAVRAPTPLPATRDSTPPPAASGSTPPPLATGPPLLPAAPELPRPSPSPGILTFLARPAAAALLLMTALAIGLFWRFIGAAGRSSAPAIRAIAVLPVANLTGDARQDDLAETFTSSLMSDLRAAKGLRVEAAHRPAEGGHPAGGVDAIVEISLLSNEPRVEIAAELIDARTGHLVWAEVVETEPVSWVDGEKRIAEAIESRLGARPASDARATARREHALARKYLSRHAPQIVEEALEHFVAATTLDPGYAPALAGLASAYLLGAQQRVLPAAEAISRAEAAARRALELAPSAEAHAALGEVAAARWDFASAEASYRRALALDPALASAHQRYAALLTVQDRHEEAISEARISRDLKPACPVAATALAAAYYHADRNDEAIEEAHAALRLAPGFAAAYDVLGWAHLAVGRRVEAIGAFGEAVRLSERSPPYVGALARVHAGAGNREEARRLLAELQRGRRNRATSPLELAEVLAALGDGDEALRQVERAGAEGTPWLQHADAGVRLAALHDDARFHALVARMHPATASQAGREPRVGGAAGSPPPASPTPGGGSD